MPDRCGASTTSGGAGAARERTVADVIRLVLAEDNLLVRQGIAGMLAAEPDIDLVEQCSAYDELLAAVARHEPQVVLTDIRMPPSYTDEGIRAARDVQARSPGTGVVVLSQYDAPEYALRLFTDGVAGRGYLLKDHIAEPNQLGAAVRAVAAGGSSIDPAVVESMISTRAAAAASPLARLTPRETEVLAGMAGGHNNTAIARSLFLTVRAVERHINSIFAKLGLTEEVDYHRRVRAVLLFLAAR
jgi:DNA-binding NarL/FixJ family response regulator